MDVGKGRQKSKTCIEAWLDSPSIRHFDRLNGYSG